MGGDPGNWRVNQKSAMSDMHSGLLVTPSVVLSVHSRQASVLVPVNHSDMTMPFEGLETVG